LDDDKDGIQNNDMINNSLLNSKNMFSLKNMINNKNYNSKKKRGLMRRQETSLRFQLANLEKTILESEDNEALVWLSRILVMSTVDEIMVCQRVAQLLVRVAAEDISSEDEKALKLAAAVWVTVRDNSVKQNQQLSSPETLALVTIYLARAKKGTLVQEALLEAHVSVKADNCGCIGRRGGGVGAAKARGFLFPTRKLCFAITNIRKFVLRSDLENSLYWLSCSVLHIRRQTRPYSWRRRMMALDLAANFRGFAQDFLNDKNAEEICEATYSLFDFVPEKYDPCGDISDIECVLALVVVRLVKAPKVDFVKETFKSIMTVKRTMEVSPSITGRESISRSVSVIKTPGKEKEAKKKKSAVTNKPKNNGEDMSLFNFGTVKGWLRHSERRGGSNQLEEPSCRLKPDDARIFVSSIDDSTNRRLT